MTGITDHDLNPSPAPGDPNVGNGNGDVRTLDSSRGIKRQHSHNAPEDDDDDEDKPGRERRKIEIKFIKDKSRRHITFSKRKAGIMKKAYELSVLTGTQVLLLVVSETGLVYTFTTPKLQPLVTKPEGKNLIQACLNAPEASGPPTDLPPEQPVESPEDPHGQGQVPGGLPPGAGLPPGYPMTPDQAMQYQSYLQQQQQQQAGNSYSISQGARMPTHP